MVFSSSIFLVYFLPIFLLIYFAVGKKYKNAVLLISSIVFYSWGAPKFIFAILATTTLDFYLVRAMFNFSTEKRRKLFLVLSLCLNVGMLFYFKYCNFFIENFNEVLSAMGFQEISWTTVVLPIGISFYTFESLTYVIDVYRKIHKPLDNFWQYQTYIIMFPKLIAGPIIRYHDISDQIIDRSQNDTIDNKLSGFLRFGIGLAKKVLIANVMAEKADQVFALGMDELNAATAWTGMLAYTFQIYFDFSGYSDMAIGIGKMLGFKFPENFDNPYNSASITEFWKRWHMTLGSWMRNYLYIPLGGNRVKSKFRLYFNLWIVFLLSGFWHGAAWTFIFWGVYHGAFLVLERAFLLKTYLKTGKWISVPFTFIIVAIGWVFFRSETISSAFAFVGKLFKFEKSVPYLFWDFKFIVILFVAGVFAFSNLSTIGKRVEKWIYGNNNIKVSTTLFFVILSAFLFIVSLSSITGSGFNPFIYFRF